MIRKLTWINALPARDGILSENEEGSDYPAIRKAMTKPILSPPAATCAKALALIAALAVASYLVSDRVAAKQHEAAGGVNLVSRQRALTERVGALSLQLAVTPVAEQREMEAALASSLSAMSTAQAALASGSSEFGIRRNAALREIYRAAPCNLDRKVGKLIANGEDYLALPPTQRANAPVLREIMTAIDQSTMLCLDQATAAVERQAEDSVSDLRLLMLVLVGVMLAGLGAEAFFVFRPLLARLERNNDRRGAELTEDDPLGGCMTLSEWLDCARRELDRSRRHHLRACLLRFDIDHFQEINDYYGPAGAYDAVCQLVSDALGILRSSDVFGRIGGDEFAVLLPQTAQEDAEFVAEKLRSSVEQAPVRLGDLNFYITISIGVCEVKLDNEDLFRALDRTDQTMQRAKREGGNRVTAAARLREVTSSPSFSAMPNQARH